MARRILAIAIFCVLATMPAYAGSATSNLAVNKSSPLRIITTGVTLDCSWSAGTVVMTLSAIGGDGQPITYSLGGTPSGDLAISGANLVVGPNGVATANCGKVEAIVINANQP